MKQISIESFLERVVTSEDRVGFTQVDSYYHMNAARYIEVALDHRGFAVEDQLKVSAYELGKQLGIAIVVKNFSVDYVSSALLGEKLEIASWADHLRSDGFSIKLTISNKETRKLRAWLGVVFRVIDLKTGRLTDLPAAWPSDSEEDLISLLPTASAYLSTLKGLPSALNSNHN